MKRSILLNAKKHMMWRQMDPTGNEHDICWLVQLAIRQKLREARKSRKTFTGHQWNYNDSRARLVRSRRCQGDVQGCAQQIATVTPWESAVEAVLHQGQIPGTSRRYEESKAGEVGKAEKQAKKDSFVFKAKGSEKRRASDKGRPPRPSAALVCILTRLRHAKIQRDFGGVLGLSSISDA